MGTYNHSYKSTYNLLRELRGLISTVSIRVISTLNLQVGIPTSVPKGSACSFSTKLGTRSCI